MTIQTSTNNKTHAQIPFHWKIPHTVTKMKNNINMDNRRVSEWQHKHGQKKGQWMLVVECLIYLKVCFYPLHVASMRESWYFAFKWLSTHKFRSEISDSAWDTLFFTREAWYFAVKTWYFSSLWLSFRLLL
jgi:hypothetical protein